MPDGKHSVDCYMACLDMCYNELSTKVAANGGNGNLVEDNDFFVNHCTSTYLCKRAFKRVCENAYPKSDEKVKSIFGCTDPAGGMTIKLKEQQTQGVPATAAWGPPLGWPAFRSSKLVNNGGGAGGPTQFTL